MSDTNHSLVSTDRLAPSASAASGASDDQASDEPDISSTPGVRASDITLYGIPSLVLLLVLGVLAAFGLMQSGPLAITHSTALDAAITTATVVISLCAVYVSITEFLLYGRLSSLWTGLAFLLFATADAGMGLVPLLAGLWRKSQWIPGGWTLELILAGCLFVAAAWHTEYEISTYRRSRVLSVGVAVCLLFAILVTGLAYQEGSSALPIPQRWLHIVAAVLFLLAAARFWRSAQLSHRIWFVWIALSLSIAAFAQIEYAFHPFAVGVIQPGDVLRFVFFVAILLALAAEWSQNYRHLRWQTRELEALHSLMTAPTVHDMTAVIQHIARVVGETLNANARVVIAESDQRFMRDPLTAQIIRLENDPSINQGSSQGVVVGFDEGEGSQIVLGVPLETAERRLGMLLIARSTHEEFSGRDVHLLRAFGTQASALLERSMLYEEIAAGAVLEERARLAREIHDGLAQHLAFLKMRIAWLQRARDRLDDSQLRDIESVLETALIEARHAITTLRARPIGTSTPEAIAGYAEEFGQVSGLEVSVNTAPNTPEVGPKTAVELLRVVQEALNNVRKHAEATQVEINMGQSGAGLQVRIRDDGRGFSTGEAFQGHFGLEIMRERTESLGGTLVITSTPGQGSQVDVWVPGRDLESAEDLPA